MHTVATHAALFAAYAAQYGFTAWPEDALLALGHSFALTYGELPEETSLRHDWAMPSKIVVYKTFRAIGDYRRALRAAYPYLAELAEWGADVIKPLVTVHCLACEQPYQTRNAAKWRLHPACRAEDTEEDSTWMNVTPVSMVRNYEGLHAMTTALPGLKRGNA